MTLSADLSLYIHWPFCVSKCPYCDFNSHVRDRAPGAVWGDALCLELDRLGAMTAGRRLVSVFFGGGTPSLMDPGIVDRLLSRLGDHWSVAPDLEVTLEANPGSSDEGRFRDFRAAGVNRLSLGVQSLRDESLRFLGRRHNGDEALRAIELAAAVFPRYSFDLIYALPGRSIDDWRGELMAALPLAGGHLSLYQLTIEPGTAFYGAHARGDFTLPPDDVAAALYQVTHEIMDSHGYYAYEVSNYAHPGQESRHNLTYWRYGDYGGIGPGAHGRLTLGGGRFGTVCYRAPETWLTHVMDHGSGEESRTVLDAGASFEEALMMGLRLREGVRISHLAALAPDHTQALIGGDVLAPLCAEGLIVLDGESIRASGRGLLTLNSVLTFILSRLAVD